MPAESSQGLRRLQRPVPDAAAGPADVQFSPGRVAGKEAYKAVDQDSSCATCPCRIGGQGAGRGQHEASDAGTGPRPCRPERVRKSTLIEILAGYHHPDPGGELEVDGRPGEAAGATGSASDLGLKLDTRTSACCRR